jgi:predicted N-acetyltransferase YhbS
MPRSAPIGMVVPPIASATAWCRSPISASPRWKKAFVADIGDDAPLVMVGPVAVAPDRQDIGIGRLLIHHALEAADSTGQDALMLIGDPEYYGRFFGFTYDRTSAWRVPGPVERHRLLARGSSVPAGAGLLGPRTVVDA